MTKSLKIPNGAIRIRKSKKERQYNDQKNKQRSTKHYIENVRSNNTNPTKIKGELRYSGRVSSFDAHLTPVVLLFTSSNMEVLLHISIRK
jgi:hypothetical protein